jgi:3-oxoacyl-[acyl-carrier protein] reductase
MNLSEAKVLITGGSSGIGLETARVLIEQGARVVICGRNEARLREAADRIGAIAVPADVSREADVLRLVEAVVNQLGGYNVLINNAAFGHFSPLVELSTEQLNTLLATNLTGAMMVARESARHFVAQQYGNIVNISSTAGLSGSAGGTAYCATKFALKGMTECWRQELRKHNIRVMLVNPSEVQTDFGVHAGRAPGEPNETKLQASEIAHTIKSLLTLNDVGFITEATVWATNPR